jgi:predicted small secreted protein
VAGLGSGCVEKEIVMKKVAGILAIWMIVSIFAGCETFRGFGRDVEHAGDEIEDSVD